MRTIEKSIQTPSFWQLVFSQSKVNGAPYNGEQLLAGFGIGRQILICKGVSMNRNPNGITVQTELS